MGRTLFELQPRSVIEPEVLYPQLTESAEKLGVGVLVGDTSHKIRLDGTLQLVTALCRELTEVLRISFAYSESSDATIGKLERQRDIFSDLRK